MTENKNPLAVRWDTEHEEADCDRLMRLVGDDVAIFLDRNGWEIRMKPACHPRTIDTVDGMWRMNRPSTATPAWASHHEDGTPQRPIGYKPYPDAEYLIFGRND